MRQTAVRFQIISIAIVIVLGFGAYSNSINGEFIWDDYPLLRDNTYIKDSSYIARIFTGDIGAGSGTRYGYYRPLSMLTYMLDYSLWRLNVKGYHLTNIALHILTALCIYWLVIILFRDALLSLLTSILFVIHPIHTEAVAYISGRPDALAAIFMLLCIISYIKQLSVPSKSFIVLTMVSFTVAVLCKENSLSLPVLVLLYHYIFKKKVSIKQFLPLLGIVLLYLTARMTFLRASLSDTGNLTTLLQRIPGFFVAITNYARLILFPFHLHMEYGNKLFNLLHPKAITGILILFSLVWYAFIKRSNQSLISFSILWFFIALLPASNIPLRVAFYMAEHYLYLPSIGFFLALAYGLSSLYRTNKLKVFAIVLVVSLASFYLTLTVRQNEYWREPLRFYKRTLRYAPDSWRVHNNMGNIYSDIGKYEEAIASYKKAIKFNPDYAEAYYNLGNTYRKIGETEKAMVSFEKAIEANPAHAKAFNNLGLLYISLDKREEAITLFKKAIDIDPEFAGAHNNLAVAYYYTYRYELAIKHCDRAIELGFNIKPEFRALLEPYR
ncbi:MAG TPA: tetratricopeptide repeat protein [Candidatus Omnitrophica bacterium]|nr:tetratricopeptide repeat protein [Candidatus Omnitrophota bacterium]